MTERMTIHQTDGGPFALIPRKKLHDWGGVFEKKLARSYAIYGNDYEMACRSNFDVDYHPMDGLDALFIEGAQYAILSIACDEGLRLMCPGTMENGDVPADALTAAFENIDWLRANTLNIAAGDEYCLFDAACCGEDILSGRAEIFETFHLPRDSYVLRFTRVKLPLADGNVLDGFACMAGSK